MTSLTYRELVHNVKKPPFGDKIFWKVPKAIKHLNRRETVFDLPIRCLVEIDVNKNGKPILNFDKSYHSDSLEYHHYFLDEKSADVHALKIQLEQHTGLIKALKSFEDKTNFNHRFNKYLNEYPEVFL